MKPPELEEPPESRAALPAVPSAVSHQVLSSFILRSSDLLVPPKWKGFHFIVLTYIFSLKKRLLLPAGTNV